MTTFLRLLLVLALSARGLTAQTLEELAADPSRWPAEVTLVANTKATVLRDGKPAGIMLLGAGKTLVVTGLGADGVTGKISGAVVRVPLDKTNLQLGAATDSSSAAPEPAVSAPEPGDAKRATVASDGTAMQRLLDRKLVRFAGGRLQHVDPAALDGVKYYALYYSASWCGPCRQFTPQLVSAYQELKAAHPELEVVFLSADHSAGDMSAYMKHDRMPWPAVKFDQRSDPLMRYSGPGIPCLVLVDANGKVLSDSYRGGDYVGPQRVLADTRRILARGR